MLWPLTQDLQICIALLYTKQIYAGFPQIILYFFETDVFYNVAWSHAQ